MIDLLLGGGMVVTLITVVGGGIAGWLRFRRLDAAQTADTSASAGERHANARVTDITAWNQMLALRSGLATDLAAIQTDLSELRAEHHELADQHRAALAHIVAVHEWDAAGRRGGMPSAPVDLKLVR